MNWSARSVRVIQTRAAVGRNVVNVALDPQVIHTQLGSVRADANRLQIRLRRDGVQPGLERNHLHRRGAVGGLELNRGAVNPQVQSAIDIGEANHVRAAALDRSWPRAGGQLVVAGQQCGRAGGQIELAAIHPPGFGQFQHHGGVWTISRGDLQGTGQSQIAHPVRAELGLQDISVGAEMPGRTLIAGIVGIGIGHQSRPDGRLAVLGNFDPIPGRGPLMLIDEPYRLPGFDLKGAKVLAGLDGGFVAGPRFPASGQHASGGQIGQQVVVVVHILQRGQHLGGRFALDGEFLAAGRPRVNVAALDQHGLVGLADQPLDVIGLGFQRKLEDDNVPARRIVEQVGYLADDDPVAGVGVVLLAVELHHVAAVGAGRFGDLHASAVAELEGPPLGVDFVAGADRIAEVAMNPILSPINGDGLSLQNISRKRKIRHIRPSPWTVHGEKS